MTRFNFVSLDVAKQSYDVEDGRRLAGSFFWSLQWILQGFFRATHLSCVSDRNSEGMAGVLLIDLVEALLLYKE